MLREGQSARTTRRFTEADVIAYVALGGAPPRAGTVPEPLIGALFSYLLGVRLPGHGTCYLKQETRFAAPAPLGRALTAQVTITRLRREKCLVDLETRCVDDAQELICTGRALVRFDGM